MFLCTVFLYLFSQSSSNWGCRVHGWGRIAQDVKLGIWSWAALGSLLLLLQSTDQKFLSH